MPNLSMIFMFTILQYCLIKKQKSFFNQEPNNMQQNNHFFCRFCQHQSQKDRDKNKFEKINNLLAWK